MTDDLETIDVWALDAVTGGRIIHTNSVDPALIQGISELAQAVQAVGQNLAQSSQANSQGMMQMMQQMMEARGGARK